MKHLPMRAALAGLLLVLGVGGRAQEAPPSWLPPAEQVRRALEATPALQAARAGRAAQFERARAVEVGPAEFNLRLSQQNRRLPDTADRYGETAVSLERPLRLWGKARLDGELADSERRVARLAYADTLHEASRDLLRQWFEAMRAALEETHAERQLALARELQRQAQARLALGDISQLDASLAEAELQRAQAGLELARSQQTAVLARLQRVYPGLPAPQPAAPALPPAPAEFAPLLQTFLRDHHELNLARAEAERLRALAARTDRERLPDPTLGVYGARERGGAENVVGVSLGFPLPGAARYSQAAAAHHEALSAQDRVRQLERQLTAAFEARWLQLRHQRAAAAGVQAAARTQELAAEKSARAYALGEHTMTELLHNRRLAQEQRLASGRLGLELAEGWAQLQLDLHALWDFDAAAGEDARPASEQAK